jgi:crooked neck
LEEANGHIDKTREVYERAIANVPPAHEKRFWRRYIYLWINYAIFEELEAKSIDNARAVYRQCLSLVPHSVFSFSKLWILFAHFELRQKNLAAARKIFGNAIGVHAKPKIFDAYIALELKLGQIDRCRSIYVRYLEVFPENCQAWVKFAELEMQLDESDRVRAIYDLAINQPQLDMPELVWKNYIDFEIECEQYDNARSLYTALLERTQHVKVWISFAQFENTIGETNNARSIYERAYKALKSAHDKEERLILLESWKEFEAVHQNADRIAYVKTLLPERVKRRRAITSDDGTPAGFEEYWDYVFPDEKAKGPSLKILEMAHKWKRQKVAEEEKRQHPPVTSFSDEFVSYSADGSRVAVDTNDE